MYKHHFFNILFQIKKPNLAYELTRYVEPDNLWIGPRQVSHIKKQLLVLRQVCSLQLLLILLNFLVTVKVVPHECVNRTGHF